MAEFDHHSSQDSPVPSSCNNISPRSSALLLWRRVCGGPTNLGYLPHLPSSPGLQPTKKSRPCTTESLYSPGHRLNLESPDRTIVEGKFGGTKTGIRGVGTLVFVTDFRRYGALGTSSWTQHTWQWLQIKGCRIEDHVGNLPLRR
jgi:hypothetical protein